MSDSEWVLIEPLVTKEVLPNRAGRPTKVSLREVVNTIFYVNRTGVQWELLPHDLVAKSTAYDYFTKWRDDGTLDEIVTMAARKSKAASVICWWIAWDY